jgi:hypothetical protein
MEEKICHSKLELYRQPSIGNEKYFSKKKIAYENITPNRNIPIAKIIRRRRKQWQGTISHPHGSPG